MNEYTQAPSVALSALENLRTRLLDLSIRNRLLNYRHGRTGNLRIVDELPDQLHELLLSEQELRFLPVPEPTREQLVEAGYLQINPKTGQEEQSRKAPSAEEWACWLSIQTSYELPELYDSSATPQKHRDKSIQTLLFPYEMETRLRDLRAKAETAIEETGANFFYLVLGFLEWFESAESETPRLAPLVLIPVRLAKGRLNRQTSTYEYTIAYSGEDILPNLSLREKLRLDFGLALPEFDDTAKPEQYFTAIRELITQNQPRWSVRRHATATLLNFSKLLMYLDLDPARWPVNKSLATHSIIKGFFEKGQAPHSGGNSFVDEYNIDELPEIHDRYPLIDDADSSQHSALVDAIKGDNLVIEGPPGTGKSQTITNLIAAALAQGKRVLFVAEKLAALEVVKRRLDKAGLGEFCLELHSHKTQKRKLLDDIEFRLQKKYRQPIHIDADIARFEELKNKLRQHAEQINSHWKTTGKSLHAILTTATRYRQQLTVDPATLHPEHVSGETFNADRQRRSGDLVQQFGEVYSAVARQFVESSDLSSHPWCGANNLDLQFFDAPRVCEALSVWQHALQKLNAWRNEVRPLFGELPEAPTELQQLADDLQHLPLLHGDERLDALTWIRGENLKVYKASLTLFREIQGLYQRLAANVTSTLLENLGLLSSLKASSEELQALGVSQETELGMVAELLPRLNRLERQLQEIDGTAAEFALRLGPAVQNMRAMHEQGLKELRRFIELSVMLEPSLWKSRHKRFDNEELDEVLPHLQARISTLREQRVSLANTFQIDRLPPAAELEDLQHFLSDKSLLRWFKGTWRAARKRILALSTQPGRRLKMLLPELDEVVRFVKDKEILDCDQKLHRLLGEHIQGLATDVDDLQKVRSWYRQVRQSYGVGLGPMVKLGQTLLDMSSDIATGMRSLVDQGFLQRIDDVLEELNQIKIALPRVEGLRQGNALLLGEQGILQTLKTDISRNLTRCQEYLVKPDFSLRELERLLADLVRLQDLTNKWAANNSDEQWIGGTFGLTIGPGRDNEAALVAAQHTESLASVLDYEIKTSALKEAIYSQPDKPRFEALAAYGQQLRQVQEEHHTTLQIFSVLTTLDLATWTRKSGDQLSALIERNDFALKNPEWLANWLDYARVKQHVIDAGFGRLVQAVEQGMLAPTDVRLGYNLGVYDFLSREILRELPQLAQFSGNVQETLQKQFREYDEKLKQLQRERIAWRLDQNTIPGGNSGGRVSDYTELALLKHECGKKTRHLPIRQLVKRAGHALAALKPCFMMGPMSVAQYLAPGELEFDVVVMDEASQMKPEDALGAVARGRQLVVVGDPNQLPPTSFFEKLVDDNEDDPTALEESESILDAAFPLFKARPLRWHYRSQHESLIAFSNQFFYGGKLVLFPSPHNDSGEYGIKFTRVHRGRFVNRRNIEEAHIIAEAVREHLLERSEESLGIVAMNTEQRDEIERAVETLAKEDEVLRSALERETEKIEPLFIKNLENVQGDERDIMFISMTYGPQDIGGPVMQRFGPINSDVGWRRLNVLFTRAKKRMHIFSSMGSENILLATNSKRGVRALKDFLAYVETGILHDAAQPSNRPPDSDFEIAVAEALRTVGFECAPQVGVAGFFIDLAVRDPGNPGRFLMGVECDGASYHSAKSVRDRDRLRQTILERLGWRMRRIWSTDWYKNPQAQLQPIIRELNALKTEKSVVLTSTPEARAIDAIVTKIEKEEEQIPASTDAGPLREQLLQFDQDVIRKACPHTLENKRLLRPAMLEALLEYQPTSKWEFLENIPPYLRQATSAEEGVYLTQVLAIIGQASQEIMERQK